jgi:hypothetical protein
VDRNHRLEDFVAGSFFKRDVTSFLAEFHKTRSFQSSNDGSPETLGSLGMSLRNFDGRPERVCVVRTFRQAPGFEV